MEYTLDPTTKQLVGPGTFMPLLHIHGHILLGYSLMWFTGLTRWIDKTVDTSPPAANIACPTIRKTSRQGRRILVITRLIFLSPVTKVYVSSIIGSPPQVPASTQAQWQ